MASRPIVQLTTEWRFIREYSSIAEAIKGTGISRSVIVRILDGNFDEESEDFLWLDKDVYDMMTEKDEGCILQFRITPSLRKKGKLMAEFSSISAASKSSGLSVAVIERCLRGKVFDRDDYIWEYKPRSVIKSPASTVKALSTLKNRAPIAEKEKELPLRVAPGLKKDVHYLVDDPMASNWIVRLPETIVIGKLRYPVTSKTRFTSGYETDIIPLSRDEGDICLQRLGVRCNNIEGIDLGLPKGKSGAHVQEKKSPEHTATATATDCKIEEKPVTKVRLELSQAFNELERLFRQYDYRTKRVDPDILTGLEDLVIRARTRLHFLKSKDEKNLSKYDDLMVDYERRVILMAKEVDEYERLQKEFATLGIDDQKSPPRHTRASGKTSKILQLEVWDAYIGIDYGRVKCPYCKGNDINPFHFQIGHVVARAKGGDMSIENLRPICSLCNQSLGTNSIDLSKYKVII